MLTIRREQMRIFQSSMRERFVGRLLCHLRAEMPAATAAMCDAELCATIREGVARAEAYGVVAEWDLCRFAMYEVRLGAGFERASGNDWAREVLESGVYDGTAKMDLLDQHYFASSRLSL